MGGMKRILGTVVRLVPALVFTCGAFHAGAQAQGYPERSIRIVVPVSPGGIADTYSRTIAARLTERWGQPVVVENRLGAGGNIGADLVAKAAPDGYTLVMGFVGSHAANPSLFKNMPYDPVRDFVPIIRVINAEGLIAIHPSVPATNLGELLSLLRANPGKYSYSSGGVGTASHLAVELFKTIARVDILHVPYKGVAPAVADLVGGQVALSSPSIATALSFIQNGRLRAIAVTDTERAGSLPAVPTVAEAGLPGYAAENWIGLFAPAGTSMDIVRKFNREVTSIMETAEVQTHMKTSGTRFRRNTPEQFAQFVRSDGEKWAMVVRKAGLVAE